MSYPLTSLPNIGKVKESEFKALGIESVEDLFLYAPRCYEDRREERKIRDADISNPTVNCHITIISHSSFPSKKGKTLKVLAVDDDGTQINLLCFNRPFLEKMLRDNTSWFLNATIQKNYGVYQTASFEIKRTKEESGLGSILPIYPLGGSLKQKDIRNAMKEAFLLLSPIKEVLPLSIREKNNFLTRDEALNHLHFPDSEESIKKAKRTLAFTELFLLELKVLRTKAPKVVKNVTATELERKFISNLPFSLTQDQEKAIKEIRSDLSKKESMNRLLEGDVGSGKTLIAWLSSLYIISKGGQVAFMAPTELLAKQHAENAAQLLSPLGIKIAFITGDVKGKDRKLLLSSLENGDTNLAIGTHALFSTDVRFKNLRYVIIDEQHRFGVGQRDALKNKAVNPHVLSMTATPIPRTLALTLFLDIDISTIKTKPEGRKPIITYTVGPNTRDKMYLSIAVEFQRKHQAYFVYPRINDEGESDLRDVMSMFTFLKEKYPTVPSAFIHSKLDEEEKMRILSDFKEKKIMYLVATSVVEVGIDIPDATCMVIEHADHFGLAALHQLRGRVGRSQLQSYCFLVFDDNLTAEAKERLSVMKNTNDGFLIAEKDLEIRGPGEIQGNKQSGFLKLKFASLTEDADLILEAKREAEIIANEDRGLIRSENAILREALTN